MSDAMPAISLAAIPGRRRAILELIPEVERRGFSAIYGPSIGDCMALCQAGTQVTERIVFGTAIAPIYSRRAVDYAQTAAFIHEISGGRFHFGVGVSHAPTHARLGISVGKPLGDMRAFIEEYRGAERTAVNGGVKWGHRGGVKRGHRRLRACPRSPREGPARDAACPQQG